jgi:predicted aspartyl protease
MANGTVDTCRRYRINNVQIGHFKVDNVIVSVSEKGKRIIVGKALLNKFRTWSLNNQQNTLVLSKQ